MLSRPVLFVGNLDFLSDQRITGVHFIQHIHYKLESIILCTLSGLLQWQVESLKVHSLGTIYCLIVLSRTECFGKGKLKTCCVVHTVLIMTYSMNECCKKQTSIISARINMEDLVDLNILKKQSHL